MAATALANAFPRKRFFLDMFTRDISLEDCILDLIDNSIDSLVREKGFDPSKEILRQRTKVGGTNGLSSVDVELGDNEINISDTCGGIPLDQVLNEVFTFGHEPGAELGQLGAYGVGLKRAIFKIAENFHIESRTKEGGFEARLDVEKWAEKDESIEDWKVPITYIEGAKSEKQAGTDISFTTLRSEVKMRLRDGAFLGRLTTAIGQTYSLFLESHVRVRIKGETIEPIEIPLGESDAVRSGNTEYTKGVVKVRIIAGLAARKPDWTYERAGWYVLCNGRVVVAADKSELTGWGTGLPLYHSKYNGFVGVVVFMSKDPLALPWTTTKRGLNRESPVYQSAKLEMNLLAKPIISFLNDMYPSDAREEPEERKIAERIKSVDLRAVAAKKSAAFEVKKKSPIMTPSVRVQFDATSTELDRVRKCIGQPRLAANKIGRHTFDHFLKTECPK